MKEEESSGSKIKKFGDILKNVLPIMPSEVAFVCRKPVQFISGS